MATFEKAQDLVRKLKDQQMSEDTITVFLREGVYKLKQGIVMTADDGGTEKLPVIYRSYEGENVVISGALPIDNYKFLAENPVLLGKETGKGSDIVEIDLQKSGLSEFRQLRLSDFNGEEPSKNFTLREVYFNG